MSCRVNHLVVVLQGQPGILLGASSLCPSLPCMKVDLAQDQPDTCRQVRESSSLIDKSSAPEWKREYVLKEPCAPHCTKTSHGKHHAYFATFCRILFGDNLGSL
jgi:hypothetical protein